MNKTPSKDKSSQDSQTKEKSSLAPKSASGQKNLFSQSKSVDKDTIKPLSTTSLGILYI